MVNVIFSGESETDIKLLIALAQKIGIKTKVLSTEEMEDIGLGIAISQGKTGEPVDVKSFLKNLRK
ncbi:MAG: hypothetical protein KDE26_23400 [Bacteroidetes bacterium]|nr:hypothetical protein [Bacteroidota bacterium]